MLVLNAYIQIDVKRVESSSLLVCLCWFG